jgi:hypothetical protein
MVFLSVENRQLPLLPFLRDKFLQLLVVWCGVVCTGSGLASSGDGVSNCRSTLSQKNLSTEIEFWHDLVDHRIDSHHIVLGVFLDTG